MITDGRICKLKNPSRHIVLLKTDNKEKMWSVKFKRLAGRRNIIVTKFALSEDAMNALVIEYLEMQGAPKCKK